MIRAGKFRLLDQFVGREIVDATTHSVLIARRPGVAQQCARRGVHELRSMLVAMSGADPAILRDQPSAKHRPQANGHGSTGERARFRFRLSS